MHDDFVTGITLFTKKLKSTLVTNLPLVPRQSTDIILISDAAVCKALVVQITILETMMEKYKVTLTFNI